MTTIKYILYRTYYLILMPYIERDKYFKIMCKEADDIIQQNL
jgi:hypothetical protein